MSPLTTELQFLSHCLRLYFGNPGASAALQNAICGKPDWDRLVATARVQGVVPLLYHALLRADRIQIPEDTWAQIGIEFQRIAANSLFYAHELTRLLPALQDGGVRAMAFKGPALAMRLYRQLSRRQCRDLDFLVAGGDVAKAVNLLRSLGYSVDPAYADLRKVRQTQKHVLLVHSHLATRVEVHWAISTPDLHFEMDFDHLWDGREDVRVLDTPISVPNHRELLLILCVHWASHCWSSLKWACDIAAFLRSYSQSDWESLYSEAKRKRCLRMLLLALELSADVSGFALPAEAERGIAADPAVRALGGEARSRSFTTEKMTYQERIRTYVRSRESIYDRARITTSNLRNLVAVRTRLKRFFSRPS